MRKIQKVKNLIPSLFILMSSLGLIACQSSPPPQQQNNQFENPDRPPKECISWFDGCNTCRTHKGAILSCTIMSCFETKAPKCLEYSSGPSKKSQNKISCKKSGGVLQKNTTGAWVCMMPTTDVYLPCDTSKECQSVCLYHESKGRGFCSKYKPFIGCGQEYQNGKHFKICN